MTLYYYEKESVCFSDKSQRDDAIAELARFYGKEFYDNKNVPHVIITDVVDKRKMYDYGVRNDYDGNKWERAKSVQHYSYLQKVDTEIKFSIGDEVITSDGATARITDVAFNEDKNCWEYLVNNERGWIVEEELSRSGRSGFEEELSRSSNFDLKQYVRDACRTECSYGDAVQRSGEYIDLLHGVIGVCTECGELQDQVKKFIFYGKELDIVNVLEEIGDCFWYFAIICKSLGLDLQKIMEKNIKKLKKRYPEKFKESLAAMENRDLIGERKVLEDGAKC